MALKLNLNRDKIVGQDSEKKESTLIQPRIKLSMAEPAAVETTKPKSYGPTISERENSVIGQLATDSKMAYRAESRNDNSLWKQAEKDRAVFETQTADRLAELRQKLTTQTSVGDFDSAIATQNEINRITDSKYKANPIAEKIQKDLQDQMRLQTSIGDYEGMAETYASDPLAKGRLGNILSGAVKQSAGATGSAFAVTTEDMLDGGRVNVRGESMDKLSFDKNKALQYTQGVRDKTMALTQSGAADIEQAKQGLGTLGRLAVDTAAGLTQLGADIGIGAATGLGAMPALAVRAFGGAADQAKMDGASVDQQVAYGLASAAVEVFAERLSSYNLILDKAHGKSPFSIDKFLDGVVAGIEDIATTPGGRAIMNRVGSILASGMGEGFEEAISGVAEPFLSSGIYGKEFNMDIKEIGYQVLIGALTGAVTGVSGKSTLDYRVSKADESHGQVIRDTDMTPRIVRNALHTDKNSEAYKMADAIRSRKAPATNEELGKLNRLTLNQLIKEAEVVEQAQSADLGQPVSTKTATVLDTGTSAYVALGMKTKRAEAKAKVVQKLINGEEVSLDGMKSLNLTDAKYREIFTQLTGVVFPEGMTNQDQLINIAKTANTVSRVEQVDPGTPVNVQTEVQEPIAQDIAQVRDDAQPLSYEQFGEAYRRTEGADLNIDEPTMRSVYDSYLEHENQTVMESGAPVTRTQFRSNLRKTEAGAKMSDREIDRYFDSYRESQTEAPKDLRHKLSKDVQDVIAAFEKKLGIRIEVTESIRSEKTGQIAEGVSDPGIIRLALDARGDLSYDEAVMQVLRHEVTHQLKRAVSEDTYNAFAKYVREFDAEFYQTQYEKVSKTYAKQFKGSDEAKKQADIDDEVIARCAEKLFEDEAFIRMVVGKNRTLAEKIHDIFEKLLKKLNLTGGAKKQLQAKRDLWAAMLNEAEENTKKGIKQGTEATVVDGKQYSYKSMSHDIREGTMYADLVKPKTLAMLDMKKSDIDELFKQLQDLLDFMAPHLAIVDYNEEYGKNDRPFHPYKENSDPLYKISLDFSTLCTKRLLMQHIIERLQLMEGKPMSAAKQMAVREKIKQYAEIEKGLQVACAMCYVESARLHSPEQVQKYLDNPGAIVTVYLSKKSKAFNAQVTKLQTDIKEKYGLKASDPKSKLSSAARKEFDTKSKELRLTYKPTAEEQAIIDTANSLPAETFLTAENLTRLSQDHPEIYDAFTSHIRSATRSKSSQTPVPYYYGDSKTKGHGGKKVSKKFIESMNAENGMRFSSWSDYMFKHVLDMMTAVIELSVRGSSMHGYTKFPQFVRVFGKTGMMFNLSGVADGMGLDDNGELIFSDSESVDIAEARKVRNQYPETAGVQCIGVSDDHIRKLMATDWIDYIIPYHVSGMSAALRRLAGIAGWSDYSDVQHAKPDPNAAKHGKEPVFSEFFVTENPGDGLDCMRKSAEKYKQLCAERGLIPKFNDFADDPNYWKLLIDRKMINQRTGALIFQKPVKPIFNFAEIRKQVREEVANYDPQREQRVFDYIVEHMNDVDSITENVQAEMKAGAKGLKTKVEELGNEMTATAVNGDGQYSFADEYVGTNPELAYLPWENQVDLALTNQLDGILRGRHDYESTDPDGKYLTSVLYVAKEPSALLQEVGLSDLPLVLTDKHLRNIVGKRWDPTTGKVVNRHNHEIPVGLVKRLPELIRNPLAIFASDPNGTSKGGIVILTEEVDPKGNPVCVTITPDQPSFVYDGKQGPAHFVNMYGRENADDFIKAAVSGNSVLYVDKKWASSELSRNNPKLGAATQAAGLTSAYNTIVREKDPTVKPGERQFSLTDEADSTGTHFLSKGQLEYFKDSKVRDENGKLIPVYHGTQRAGFTEFSETDDYGYFFTSSLTLANTYSGGGGEFAPRRVDTWDDAIAAARDLGFVLERDSDGSYVLSNDWYRSTWNEDELRDLEAELYEADSAGRGVYATYLNLKDPLIIEGGGASWDSITGSEFQDSIEAVAQDGELELVIRDRVTGEERLRRNFTDFEDVREALIDLYGGEEDAITDIMDRLQAEIDEEMQFGNYDDDTIDIDYGGYWGYGRSTRDWVREAMEEGYDGVIFKNIVDAGKYGYGSESGDVYVALNANQIKSVNNLNPTEDPDLRYSFADDENRDTMEYTEKEGMQDGREAEIHRDVGTVLIGGIPGNSREGAETKSHEVGRREIRFDQIPEDRKARVTQIIHYAFDVDPEWRDFFKGLPVSKVTQYIFDGYQTGVALVNTMREQIPGFEDAMERAVDFAVRGKMKFKNRTGEATAAEETGPHSTLEDEEYMKAVESGDMVAAQRMVDEAAKAAGYTREAYHGTYDRFFEFLLGDLGYHIGTREQAEERLKDTDAGDGKEPRILKLFAKIKNPLWAAFDFGDWGGQNVAGMLLETEQWEEGYHEGAEEINARLEEIAQMPKGEQADKVLREFLQSLGYDGVRYQNDFEGDSREDSYIAFESNQLKLADPVTYDDNGNVIPLSKRFDSSNEDIRYSLADDLTPEKRKAFIETFDAEFGEGAAEQMFKAHDQMARAAARAEKRAEKAAESKTAAETLAKEKSERDLTAFLMYHNRKLREQQRKYADDKAKLQKAKAEAVKEAVETTKLVERAKADIRVQATEMHLGKKAAERERTLKERMVELKAEAADRLRVTKDTYRGKMKEMSKLQRNAAKHLLSDKKAAEKRKNEIQTAQGPIDTIRKNPRERVKVEKMKAAAEALRTLHRAWYRNFVNAAQGIDNFAKRQKGGFYASDLVTLLGGSGSAVERIFKSGLTDREGNRIGESLKDVLLCMDATGKKVDEAKQALLQDYILHLHNIDRMSFVAKAKALLDAFESNPENAWLVGLDGKDLAMLVAATDAEVADSIAAKLSDHGKVKRAEKGKSGWTEADRQLAQEYASLLHNFLEAKDKPVFADENGNPVTADTSREIVAKYEKDNAWLIDKANGIFEWWDLFMRNWAVGDSLSLAEYEIMHETYPHYAPTYRVGKAGPGGANSVNGTSASVSKATKAAKGSTLEIVNIEDSFANIASKIVRLARTNQLYMNIIDTAMLDEEGLFSDMAVFDWDWHVGEYAKALQVQNILDGETAEEIEAATKVGLTQEGKDYYISGWKDGRVYRAKVHKDLFTSIADTTGYSTSEVEKMFLKAGNALTGPMKTAITGANPAFSARNTLRDLPTAIINSTGPHFLKYWKQAGIEMLNNSENWQVFQALGGVSSGYYNNNKGFAHAMSLNPNAIQKVKGAFEWFGNNSEAITRFAEYLSTIDRLGDTYEARVKGIKNAAEVTVDFSRSGRVGRHFNAWIPYWNPAIQGTDKLLRSVFDAPDGSTLLKQAMKTGGRAAMNTALIEVILQVVLHAIDRDDEWEKLSDRDKAQYYCIPLVDEHKFLKIPKNREWGAILGTPVMLVLESIDGRPRTFETVVESYWETSLEPNFLPPAVLRPDFKDGGFSSDIIGVSWMAELGKNEDFAGRAIVPYSLEQGSRTEQYNDETSVLIRKVAQSINFSPMQLQYMLTDYFGDFGKTFAYLNSPSFKDNGDNIITAAWSEFFGSFEGDNRYSNQTVSSYYEAVEELDRVVQDKKNHGAEGEYLLSKEYKTQKGLEELYGKQITELNKEVRGLPDGPDKDALKEEIARLAGEAMDYYNRSMTGEIAEPQLTAKYAALPTSVSNELIRLDSFAADYAFEPTGTASSKYTDPEDEKREYVLTKDDEAKDVFRTIYFAQYGEVMTEAMNKSKYRKANDQKKVEMLEEARDTVLERTKDDFFDWLAANRRSTLKK